MTRILSGNSEHRTSLYNFISFLKSSKRIVVRGIPQKRELRFQKQLYSITDGFHTSVFFCLKEIK